MDRERFVALWRSHNRLTGAAGPERLEQLMGEMESYLDAEGFATIEVPYLCRAWSVRRV